MRSLRRTVGGIADKHQVTEDVAAELRVAVRGVRLLDHKCEPHRGMQSIHYRFARLIVAHPQILDALPGFVAGFWDAQPRAHH